MIKNENKNLMIIAGEVSGDLHGSSLVRELKNMDSSLNIYGIGGDRMKDEGMEIIYHIKKMAFLGFAEVVKHLPFIKRVQHDLIAIIKEKNIKNVVLIDYPGFNLNFAKKLKALNLNVIYYISPQIWAWGAGRINKIKKLVSKMIVVFPFEETFYKDSGVNVEFVGHPLLERINEHNFLTKDELFEKFNLDKSKEILLILPGSRLHEVERILPESIEAAEKITGEFNLQAVIAGSPNISEKVYNKISNKKENKIITGYTYELMRYSKIGIIKSGTSTLESALFTLPMIIVYKTGFITYSIGKKLVRVKNIGMANIVAEEKVVPELIQKNANAESIYLECKKILSDEGLYNSIKQKLSKVKDKLGSEGASRKAAGLIYSMM
ncbi:MAG: lipid-A-disaccharide synthase [Ignavibacteriaceae bacterium]|jgi:lipid-A-disaccharide synthase